MAQSRKQVWNKLPIWTDCDENWEELTFSHDDQWFNHDEDFEFEYFPCADLSGDSVTSDDKIALVETLRANAYRDTFDESNIEREESSEDEDRDNGRNKDDELTEAVHVTFGRE